MVEKIPEKKESLSRKQKIARLNDNLRIYGQGGMILATRGIQALDENLSFRIAQAIREFDDFKPENDPYGEHDFGAVEVDGVRCFWKIDYYDLDLKMHSPDESDPNVTQRVMTVMLAEEY